jgi:Uma2 family endonuclease
MSSLARVSSPMTPEEYFAFEEKTPLKHEYLDGVVYAMVGATDRHNMIALNIAAFLHAARPTGCQIEVASPSTERIDRGEKLNAYRQIPALSEYVIVAQDQPEIEVYRRRNGWVREVLKPGEALVLEGIGITLSPSQVYRDIEF